MLQNVGHAGRILGYGQERDQECIVVVVRSKVEMPRPGGVVPILLDIQVQTIDVRGAEVLEGRVGHGSVGWCLCGDCVRRCTGREEKIYQNVVSAELRPFDMIIFSAMRVRNNHLQL